MAAGHRTGLMDIINAANYLMNPPKTFEEETQQMLSRNQAVYNQQLQQRQSLLESLGQDMTAAQKLQVLSQSPAFTSKTPLVNYLEQMAIPKPRYTNIGFGPDGLPQAFDTQSQMAVTIPTAPGFVAQKRTPLVDFSGANIGNPSLSPWENKALDESMGKGALEHYKAYRDDAHNYRDIYSRIKNMDAELDDAKAYTGFGAKGLMEAQKALIAAGIETPELVGSVGAKEIAEMYALKNATEALKAMGGNDSDSDFIRAYNQNPNILSTRKGRKLALKHLERDYKKRWDRYSQARQARKENQFDITFEPEEQVYEDLEMMEQPGPSLEGQSITPELMQQGHVFRGVDGREYFKAPDGKTYSIEDE